VVSYPNTHMLSTALCQPVFQELRMRFEK